MSLAINGFSASSCRLVLRLAVLTCLLSGSAGARSSVWTQLFDGRSLSGWTASENTGSWSVVDGSIRCSGRRSHLFYTGSEAPFEHFEIRVDVKTEPGSNSGLYFLTAFQDAGWPSRGYEAQINNSYAPDPKRTGSLYGRKNVTTSPVHDGEWFTLSVSVLDGRARIRVNGELVVEHRLPPTPPGTFALQAHDPGSRVWFRNIRVRPL